THLVEVRSVGLLLSGPAGEEDRVGRPFDRADELVPEVLGQKREQGGDDAHSGYERAPEGAQGSLVAVPEPPPGAPDVPVGEILDEIVEGADDVDREPALVGACRVCHEQARTLDEPAVEGLELTDGPGGEIAVPRLEPCDVRVVDEESSGVPERQETPLDLLRRVEAELEVLTRRLRAELPAHDVGAH